MFRGKTGDKQIKRKTCGNNGENCDNGKGPTYGFIFYRSVRRNHCTKDLGKEKQRKKYSMYKREAVTHRVTFGIYMTFIQMKIAKINGL